ncbi:hypothetical protein TKK_0009876 [Trichogramma kaykai]
MDSFEKEYPDLADVCKHFWDCGIESEQFYTVEISNIESLLRPFSISKKNSFISSYFFEKNLHLDKISESSSNTNNNIINNKRPHSPEDIIVSEIDNPRFQVKITTPVFMWLRDQLTEVFPTTEEDLWYIEHAKATSTTLEVSEGGKLYWSYKELRRKYRKVGIIVDDDDDNEENATDKAASISTESANNQLFASFYDCLTDPDREKYNDVIVSARWTDTFKKRINLLCKKEGKNFLLTPNFYVHSFKCLLDHSSISLLVSDIETIINEFYITTKITTGFYARSENFFETQWPIITKKFMTIVKVASGQNIKDFKKKHQPLIDAGKHDNLLALFALPWYLNNSHEGITRKQAADAFFLHLKDDSNLAVDRENHEKTLEKLSIRIPLYVILCGTIESISKCYLVFNETIISYSNPFKAILTCIKCQAALRSWPIACEPIYAFFQFIIYKIPMNKSLFFVYKTHASAKNLIEKLQINKK